MNVPALRHVGKLGKAKSAGAAYVLPRLFPPDELSFGAATTVQNSNTTDIFCKV